MNEDSGGQDMVFSSTVTGVTPPSSSSNALFLKNARKALLLYFDFKVKSEPSPLTFELQLRDFFLPPSISNSASLLPTITTPASAIQCLLLFTLEPSSGG